MPVFSDPSIIHIHKPHRNTAGGVGWDGRGGGLGWEKGMVGGGGRGGAARDGIDSVCQQLLFKQTSIRACGNSPVLNEL